MKTYDHKCLDLADDFMSDHPHLWTSKRVHELAILIQKTIDEYIADEQDNYEPPDRGDAWSGGFADNH
jgi:hypothetical protein